jgi:hypothetical protein
MGLGSMQCGIDEAIHKAKGRAIPVFSGCCNKQGGRVSFIHIILPCHIPTLFIRSMVHDHPSCSSDSSIVA